MERLYTAQELASCLSIPLATLYRFNYLGTGPERIRVGRHVRYRESDVQRWLEANVTAHRGAA